MELKQQPSQGLGCSVQLLYKFVCWIWKHCRTNSNFPGRRFETGTFEWSFQPRLHSGWQWLHCVSDKNCFMNCKAREMRGRVEGKLSNQPGLPLSENTAEENQVFVGWRFADMVDQIWSNSTHPSPGKTAKKLVCHIIKVVLYLDQLLLCYYWLSIVIPYITCQKK